MVLSSSYILMCLVPKDKFAIGRSCSAVGCWFSVDTLTVLVTQGVKNTAETRLMVTG